MKVKTLLEAIYFQQSPVGTLRVELWTHNEKEQENECYEIEFNKHIPIVKDIDEDILEAQFQQIELVDMDKEYDDDFSVIRIWFETKGSE